LNKTNRVDIVVYIIYTCYQVVIYYTEMGCQRK